MLPPRGYIFIGLNIVRILSLVALILVVASNILVLVNDIKAVNHFEAEGQENNGSNSTATMADDYISGSTVPNQQAGAFWAVLNRLLIIGQVMVLFLSELGFPMRFFDRYFPVLGKTFGLGALGVIQMLIGAAILSHHVDTFTLVSAFFLFSIGCLNVFLGLIFREKAKSKRSITSWREHTKNVLPTPVQQGLGAAKTLSSHWPSEKRKSVRFSDSSKKQSFESNGGLKRDFSGMGFGRQGEKAASVKGYMLTKPVESLSKFGTTKSDSTGDSDRTLV
ncbi:hypothetical protein AGABI1DRAFT_115677 [Agaricus bisporus var. burnettii JB137-S8]|uniref:DUF7598 domain-containing protein n=1 Tax=Agaricus bisporus var. burnettii (strain JB137-S8 / ATCC MYA-4627 / FGSC 10392) TaxID=597362 RepID=K5XPD7_AGABU|nr:uncharacterized protein AGABI1DRAFT_115677 [Agaricus bisporus var. burnettii JB137-S8]EKM76560.1 hypothetical protein AGABI1DRAFT_115677 [Agaricus bisporus var. burnettii JB137-S8]